MSRVRFAPSPTVYLHIGSARTFIFNWMYEWKNQGTMILRIDDTDLERNTEAPLQSNYDGLRWSVLGWDEEHRQSERLELHRRLAWEIFEKGLAYRDFTPAMTEPEDADELAEEQKRSGPRLLDPGMPELSREESDRRAAAGEPFVLHFRVPRDLVREVRFDDVVFGAQSKLTADIEDFALLGGNGLPTYHMASCADDADLRISPIIRGQNHLFNTYKHLLIFEVLGGGAPCFAHLPRLVAPDGAKLSKRKHGAAVSVTTYRDAGFLPHVYVSFLCLPGWSPKDNREQMTPTELIDAFTLENVNRSNALVNPTEEDPINQKALWLNAQHLRTMAVEDLALYVRTVLREAELPAPEPKERFLRITDINRGRYATLLDFPTKGRAYFAADFPMQPEALAKTDSPQSRQLAERLDSLLEFTENSAEDALRGLAVERGVKAGLLINESRAVRTGQQWDRALSRCSLRLDATGRSICGKSE